MEPARSGDPAWTLGATCLCLTEDLGLPPEACKRPIAELVDTHQVIAAFVKRRRAHPIGNETIQALLPPLVAYALHSGRYRAATWHHEAAGIVWLLAARWHEQGSTDDSCPYFEQLLRTRRLLPTRADVEHVVDQRRPAFARALSEDVPRLRRLALARPGHIQEGVIGGASACGLPLRMVPPVWDIQLLAAFFPGISLEDIDYIDGIAGHDLKPEEVGYCGLVPGR